MNNKYCKRINFIFINKILILINISRALRLIHFDLFRTGNLHIAIITKFLILLEPWIINWDGPECWLFAVPWSIHAKFFHDAGSKFRKCSIGGLQIYLNLGALKSQKVKKCEMLYQLPVRYSYVSKLSTKHIFWFYNSAYCTLSTYVFTIH